MQMGRKSAQSRKLRAIMATQSAGFSVARYLDAVPGEVCTQLWQAGCYDWRTSLVRPG
jgi:hypothetical protein